MVEKGGKPKNWWLVPWRSDIALLAVTVDGLLGPGGGGCGEAPAGAVKEGII